MFTEHDKNNKYTITGMKDAVKGPLLEFIECSLNVHWKFPKECPVFGDQMHHKWSVHRKP